MTAETTNLQRCVIISSTQAENVALTEAVKTIAWLRNVISELGVHQNSSHIVQDSVGCVEWANGETANHFSKRGHIDIKRKYVMSMLDLVIIKIVTVRATDMRTEFLTKPFVPKELKCATDAINIFH